MKDIEPRQPKVPILTDSQQAYNEMIELTHKQLEDKYPIKGGVSYGDFRSDVSKDLASIINKHSLEADSNTPDFILANYLLRCLHSYNEAVCDGNNWSEGKSPSQVDHPNHYNQQDKEVIDMMLDIYGEEDVIAFCRLNAFKYRMRAGHKGDATQDIEKALWYETKINELQQ